MKAFRRKSIRDCCPCHAAWSGFYLNRLCAWSCQPSLPCHAVQELSEETQYMIAARAKPVKIAPGHELCSQGDSADCVWLLHEGKPCYMLHHYFDSDHLETQGNSMLLGDFDNNYLNIHGSCMLLNIIDNNDFGIHDSCMLPDWFDVIDVTRMAAACCPTVFTVIISTHITAACCLVVLTVITQHTRQLWTASVLRKQ